MPGVSVSHLIWFIISVVVAAGLSGALITLTNSYIEAMEIQGRDKVGDLETDIEIINDADAVPYDPGTGTLTIYVKNVGSCDVSRAGVVVIANGTGVSPPESNVTILTGEPSWRPGAVAQITVTIPGLIPGEVYDYLTVLVNGDPYGTGKDTIYNFRIAG
jgi:flagellar protein FlaG